MNDKSPIEPAPGARAPSPDTDSVGSPPRPGPSQLGNEDTGRKTMHASTTIATDPAARNGAPAPESEVTPRPNSPLDTNAIICERLALVETQLAGLRIQLDRAERLMTAAGTAAKPAGNRADAKPAGETASIEELVKEFLVTSLTMSCDEPDPVTDRNYALWDILEESQPETLEDCTAALRFARHIMVRMHGDSAAPPQAFFNRGDDLQAVAGGRPVGPDRLPADAGGNGVERPRVRIPFLEFVGLLRAALDVQSPRPLRRHPQPDAAGGAR